MHDGDAFDYNGRSFKFKVEDDSVSGAPWENCTPLVEPSARTYRDKAPGEYILHSCRDGRIYYDFQAAVKAGRDQGLSRREAARQAQSEFTHFWGWINDKWSYVGAVVTLLDHEGDETRHVASLWGIESNAGACLGNVATELASEICAELGIESDLAEQAARMGIATIDSPMLALPSFAQN